MINKLLVAFILCSLYSCNKENTDALRNDSLEVVINSYIKSNPHTEYRIKGKSTIESGTSYPSYHLFFNKKRNDTILSIILFPHLTPFELEGDLDTETNDGSIIYKSIIPKGFVYYREKYPLIIFDNEEFSSNFIDDKYLINVIPDSLKAGYELAHIKFNRWDFKISNNTLVKLTD